VDFAVNTETGYEVAVRLTDTAPVNNAYAYRMMEPGCVPLDSYTQTAQVTAVSRRSAQRGGGGQR
jgi:hypothetical protein